MALASPKLDDRHFQDIVDEAKKLVPRYCEEWTDHNVSDPGVTLIELFAWMTDIILYRLNQVPRLHYIKFMEMLGIRLQEPIPARVPVTFWLSAPQETTILIPAGTEVSSTQTETERSIIFTTDHDFQIKVPQLQTVVAQVAAVQAEEKSFLPMNLRRLAAGFEGISIFSSMPQVDDALYFGFANDLSHHILNFTLDCDPAGGAGIDPTLPPYIWEASSTTADSHWLPCEIEFDTTKGLNSAGQIQLHLPQMGRLRVNQEGLFWVRVRVIDTTAPGTAEGMRPYRVSPRLRQVTTASWGGTIATTHAQRVNHELLGRSDGSAGQRFQLQMTPILDRRPDEHVIVSVEGEVQEWIEVRDFADSRAIDRHYTLDSITGEIRFGPAIRQPDGTMKLFGAIPQRGASVYMARYRYGGTQEGNVQAGVINTLKTAIPFVGRVMNRQDAAGGMDAESLEAAMMRAPQMLRTRDRAVTEADFEFLTRQAMRSNVGRVKCLQPRPSAAGRVVPGQIYVLVIPRVMRPQGFLEPATLELDEETRIQVTEYLDERRLLTARLNVRTPAYRWVSVKVQCRAIPGVDQNQVEQAVLRALYQYLNPLVGGPDGTGWPFGRDLFVSDVYQCLQRVPSLQFVRGIEMRAARPGGPGTGEPLETLEVVAHGVIASGLHEVEFV